MKYNKNNSGAMMNETDQRTKQAWEKNWESIPMERILEIFEYPRVRRQIEIFRKHLPMNERILEGGCGLSPYVIHLRKLGYRICGVDYNEAPIKKALAYDPSLPISVGDVTRLDFPDATFGGYLSLGVIEHFTEGPGPAIREAFRVLKKNGVFIVAVPVNNIYMKFGLPIRWLKSRPWIRRLAGKCQENHYWEHYFGKNELKAMLEKEGFEVEALHALDHDHALMSFCGWFRARGSYDEVNAAGRRLSAFLEKRMPWATAGQMTFVARKKGAR